MWWISINIWDYSQKWSCCVIRKEAAPWQEGFGISPYKKQQIINMSCDECKNGWNPWIAQMCHVTPIPSFLPKTQQEAQIKISLLGPFSLCCLELCLMGIRTRLPFPRNHLPGAQTLQQNPEFASLHERWNLMKATVSLVLFSPLLKCVGINWKWEVLLGAKTQLGS